MLVMAAVVLTQWGTGPALPHLRPAIGPDLLGRPKTVTDDPLQPEPVDDGGAGGDPPTPHAATQYVRWMMAASTVCPRSVPWRQPA